MFLKGRISRQGYVSGITLSYLLRLAIAAMFVAIFFVGDLSAEAAYRKFVAMTVPVLLFLSMVIGVACVVKRARTVGWSVPLVSTVCALYWTCVVILLVAPLRELAADIVPGGMALELLKVVVATVFILEIALAFRRSHALR